MRNWHRSIEPLVNSHWASTAPSSSSLSLLAVYLIAPGTLNCTDSKQQNSENWNQNSLWRINHLIVCRSNCQRTSASDTNLQAHNQSHIHTLTLWRPVILRYKANGSQFFFSPTVNRLFIWRQRGLHKMKKKKKTEPLTSFCLLFSQKKTEHLFASTKQTFTVQLSSTVCLFVMGSILPCFWRQTNSLIVCLTDWLVGCSNSLSRTAPSSCAVQFKSFTTLFTVAPLVISPLCVCICVINCVRRQRRQQQHSVTFFSLCEFVQETRQRAKVALASSPQPVHLLHLVDKGERGREGDRRRKPKKKVNSVPLFSLTPFAFVSMWILSHLTLNWWTDWCYHHHHYCCWPWTQPPWPPQ